MAINTAITQVAQAPTATSAVSASAPTSVAPPAGPVTTIHKILNEPPKQPNKKLRVAAYCRVSTELDEQYTSFAMQIKAYTQKITDNPDWELAGIFADEGITGTSAEKRPKFMEMIKACENGYIDLVITKSISRFARNTVECLHYTKVLEDHGVGVIFENDRIDTRSSNSKILFTLLAGFAEEESRSISENCKWGIRKRFENGEAHWSRLYGYRKKEKNANPSPDSSPDCGCDNGNGGYTPSSLLKQLSVHAPHASGQSGQSGQAGQSSQSSKCVSGATGSNILNALADDGIDALNAEPRFSRIAGRPYTEYVAEKIGGNTAGNNSGGATNTAVSNNNSGGANNNYNNYMNYNPDGEGGFGVKIKSLSIADTPSKLGQVRKQPLFCDDYEIVPEEAAVVKRIFHLYEHGKGLTEIIQELAKNNIPTAQGKPVWNMSSIIEMLTNERYAGDIQLQKSYVENHITHKLVPNDCTKIASYYIENHHVPIISHKQFRRVNEIREMRGGKPRSLHFLSNDDRASSIGSGRIRTLRSASGGSGSGGFGTFSDSGYLRWPNQYPFGSKLRCPFCGAILRQQQFMQYSTGLKSRIYAGLYCTENPSTNTSTPSSTAEIETETDIAMSGSTGSAGSADTVSGSADTASAASTGSTCCHNFIIPSSFVLKAILDAYRDLNIPKVRTKLDSPKFHRAAVTMLSMKTKHKTFSKVDYWWLDDLVDHIEFGRHSYTQSEIDKMKAAGDEFIDDRVIRIFWRCGIVSTVPSGVKNDKDDPQYLVERYRNYLKKQAAKAIADKALTEVVETGMTGVTSTVRANSTVGTGAVGSRRAAGAGTSTVKTVGATS